MFSSSNSSSSVSGTEKQNKLHNVNILKYSNKLMEVLHNLTSEETDNSDELASEVGF